MICYTSASENSRLHKDISLSLCMCHTVDSFPICLDDTDLSCFVLLPCFWGCLCSQLRIIKAFVMLFHYTEMLIGKQRPPLPKWQSPFWHLISFWHVATSSWLMYNVLVYSFPSASSSLDIDDQNVLWIVPNFDQTRLPPCQISNCKMIGFGLV